MTSPIEFFGSPKATASAALNNPEKTKRVLDQMIRYMEELKQVIDDQDAEILAAGFEHLDEERLRWYQMRLAADWESDQEPVDIPSSSEFFGQILLGSTRKKKKK